MWNDDYVASFNYANQSERITGLKQIIKSQIWTYFNWSGGVIGLALQQFVAVWLKKPVFDILNTLILFFTACLVTFSVNRLESKYILFVLALFWIFAPVPGETIFWMISSIGYLWMPFLALIFLLFENRLKNKFTLAFSSVIIGALSLNVSVILIPLYGLKWLLGYLKTRKSDIHSFIILSGLIMGFLLLFLAPGNMQRFNNMYVAVPLVDRLPDFITYLICFLKNNAVILIIVAIYLFVIYRRSQIKKVNSNDQFLLFSCAFLSPIAMIFAPEYSERTTFVAFVFMLPFTLKAFSELVDLIKHESIKDFVYLSPVFLSFCLMALFIESKLMVFTIDLRNKLEITEAKINGKSEVELDIITIPSDRYSFIYNIRKNKNYIANQHTAAYYDLKSVRAKGDYLKITFDDIIVGNFNLKSKFQNGDLYNNPQMVYNKFDGQSVFFDLPDGNNLDSIIQIEIQPSYQKVFSIRGIEICKASKIFKIEENQIKNYLIDDKFKLKNGLIFKTNSVNKVDFNLKIKN
jgi:hypothetical protein